jgi:hypothetical protein
VNRRAESDLSNWAVFPARSAARATKEAGPEGPDQKHTKVLEETSKKTVAGR